MKVYLVNAWNNFYPDDDNTIAVFFDVDKAEEWLLEHLKTTQYRLGYYEIFEKTIEDGTDA